MKFDIGIRREDKSEWERRTPLTPSDIEWLKSEHSISVVVQSSDIRAYSDEDYNKAGIKVDEKLEAPVVLGIKEVGPQFLEKDKIYMFFSHTIKGQEYNMPMLKKMMEKKNTLIDYECITDEEGERLIAFGRYAGIAGVIETLHATGKRLEWEGYRTPFLHIKRPLSYESSAALESDTGKIGKEIKRDGLPEELTPFIIGIAGYGNVSGGVQKVLENLPVIEITPEDIFSLEDNPHTIYKVVFKEEHMVDRKNGKDFDLQDYYDNPDSYEGKFNQYIPHLSILINAIYWDSRYPRLLTKKQLQEHFERAKEQENPFSLRVIGDISCDIEGAIECTEHTCEPDEPFYVYNPLTDSCRNGYEGKGVVIMAVDILPAELPRESSEYFSDILREFIPDVVNAKYSGSFEDCNLCPSLKRAVILYKGKLTPGYSYLKSFVK